MSIYVQNQIPIGPRLYKAAVEGRFDEFDGYGASLDRLLTSKQDTILHIYCNSTAVRSAEFAHKVFDKCPQLIKQANENGDTPLHIAARNNHSKMVRLLIQLAKTRDLESGQEPGAEAKQMLRMTNNNKDTALHEAVRWDNFTVVEEILAEEDLDFKYGVNNSGETPLYLAAHCSAFSSLDVMLKAYQSKPVAYQGPNGKTILHAAIVFCSNHPDVACKIIESMGSLVNEADENGWTPLHYAVCSLHCSSVVLKILEEDISSAYMTDNDRKRTPLHLAACLGNLDAMRNIISMCTGCAELTDYRGWNVCHFAAISKSYRALKQILENSSLSHLEKCRDISGYYPIELYIFATSDSNKLWWNLNVHYGMYFRLENEPAYEISKKKEEIQEWTKELGNGPLGKLVPATSPEEKRKDMEEKIIPELEKAKDSHLVAAILVATVSFAAAFTLPGGYVSDVDKSNNLKLGSPILIRSAAFRAFVVTDGIALVLSTCSVFIHFIMVLLGYKHKYYWLIRSAFWFIVIAMGAMVVAFVTGTYAVLSPDSFQLALLTCIIGLSFFLFVFYTVVRFVLGLATDRVIDLDGPYLGPRYLCFDWCLPALFGCYCLICCPVALVTGPIAFAWSQLQQLRQRRLET